MISAFVHRRPWAAVLISVIFSPAMGMLYLGRGRAGLAWFFLTLAGFALLVVAAHLELLPLSLESAILLAGLAVVVGGAVHCGRTAAKLGGAVPGKWFAHWYALLAICLVSYLVPGVVRGFIWEPFNSPSSSMEPTLQVGDHFFVSKLAYSSADPQHGDLIVFLSPEDNRTNYVKRLEGLPGDRLQWQAGVLYLNGSQLRRAEVAPPLAEVPGTFYRETLPSGRSYLIREIADDHRFDNTDVYEVPEGHYFFVGDSRDNSLDSRSILGFVPRENLIGKITLIYWNSEAQKLRFIAPD
jgi:signal peptidase I